MKSKKKTKTTKVKTSKPKAEKYPAHILAILLMSTLLLEGILIGSTSKMDWSAGAEILDVTETVSQTAQDMSLVFQPVLNTIDGVNAFYASAANVMMPLLDMSKSFQDVSLVWDGVNAFYEETSIQMAQVLDVSSVSSWPSAVAGASIER